MSTRLHRWFLLGLLGSLSAATAAQGTQPPSVAAEHSVRILSGETLQALSLRLFGTNRLWWRIHHWNKNRIADPNRIAAGTELIIRLDADTIKRSRKFRRANKIETAEMDFLLANRTAPSTTSTSPPEIETHPLPGPTFQTQDGPHVTQELVPPTQQRAELDVIELKSFSLPIAMLAEARPQPAAAEPPPPPDQVLSPYWNLELPR